MTKLAVLNKNGKESGSVDLPEEIFGTRVNKEVIHQAVTMYRASLRQGTLSTKGRAFVSGGGVKPFRQKGTGRARAGSSRSPLWTGGGVIFGPQPRDFGYSIPKQIRKAALRESLNAKFQNKNLVCLTDLTESIDKTKEFATILGALGLKGKVLAVLDGSDKSIERVSRNIPLVNLMRACDVNAYEVMKNKNVLVSQTALKSLLERITK